MIERDDDDREKMMIERGMMIERDDEREKMMIERGGDDMVLTLCGMQPRHVIVLHLQLDELKKIIRIMVMIVMIVLLMMIMIIVVMMMTMMISSYSLSSIFLVHSPSCFVSLSQAVVAAHPHPAVSLLSTCIINSDDDDRW